MMQPTDRYLPPPPPLTDGTSPWEACVVEEVAPMVASLARRVRGLEVADADAGDATQRILEEVTKACRRWAKVHGPTRPDERYIWSAIHRARRKLYRTVKRASPRATIRPGDGSEAEAVCVALCDRATPAEAAEARSQHALYVQVAAGVYATLTEQDAALLRMSAEGMTPAAIAAEVGRPGDNVAISQRLYVLRRRAREHLAGLGIWTLDDVHALGESPPDVGASHPD
jgi:DNA-directed RNA polymerase specialized sigma24 family protein